MAKKFHTELQDLRQECLEIAHLGRDMLRSGVDSLIQHDSKLAESVISRREEMRQSEIRLEEHCYTLIALYQPMAQDMRTIVCTLKIIQESIRIGRYGIEIAKIVHEVADNSETANMVSIRDMADLVIDMVDDAIRAYESYDLKLIEDFSLRDDKVDALWHSKFQDTIGFMVENPKTITQSTYSILIARYLERSGDHAGKMAENIYYMITGDHTEIK